MGLFRGRHYAFPAWLTMATRTLDIVALCGFLLAFGFALWMLRKWPYSLELWIAVFFLILACAFRRSSYWVDVYDYSRPLTPLILVVAAHGVQKGPWWVALSLVMLDLRILEQLGSQAAGIVRGLL